jgi:hypothetical protein
MRAAAREEAKSALVLPDRTESPKFAQAFERSNFLTGPRTSLIARHRAGASLPNITAYWRICYPVVAGVALNSRWATFS